MCSKRVVVVFLTCAFLTSIPTLHFILFYFSAHISILKKIYALSYLQSGIQKSREDLNCIEKRTLLRSFYHLRKVHQRDKGGESQLEYLHHSGNELQGCTITYRNRLPLFNFQFIT
eukprot:m.76179 g.76179  ORF g.76179 m.76179 type:complete len:116 (-) comp8508_c0_seq2:298-645(-)